MYQGARWGLWEEHYSDRIEKGYYKNSSRVNKWEIKYDDKIIEVQYRNGIAQDIVTIITGDLIETGYYPSQIKCGKWKQKKGNGAFKNILYLKNYSDSIIEYQFPVNG